MRIRQKTVPGVLGGMGPQATVDFMAKIVAMTPAKSDQDHISLLIDHNPRVPNRHEAIAGNDLDVKAALAAMASTLERAGADFLVMVCNTAHAFQTDIVAAVDIPFVSIVDELILQLDVQCPVAGGVGVMAADGAIASGLYQNALVARGREAIIWSVREQAEFMSLVYRIKAGETNTSMRLEMEQLAQSLVERGAEVLVAACTEIPLLMPAASFGNIPLLSSTDILVQRTIDYALGNRPLPGA